MKDPFEPQNNSYYNSCKNEMKKLMNNRKLCNAEAIIEYLKTKKAYYRWDLFCWLWRNYSFSNKELCRLFKFSWIHSAPDVRAVEVLAYLDASLLMDKSELKFLNGLPDTIKVYKVVSSDCMVMEDVDEWDPGFDWKWSMDLEKMAYIARCMKENYIVISTTIPKTDVLAFFQGVNFSYELIAKANAGRFEEYTIEIIDADAYLQQHPYYHDSITEESTYRSTGF